MARVRRFVVYACSFGLNGSMTPYVKFNKHNFCWPHAVAEHYNLHLSNRSRPGTNIDTQFPNNGWPVFVSLFFSLKTLVFYG